MLAYHRKFKKCLIPAGLQRPGAVESADFAADAAVPDVGVVAGVVPGSAVGVTDGVGLGVGVREDVGLDVGLTGAEASVVGVLGSRVPGVVAGVVPGEVGPGFTGVGFVVGFVDPGFVVGLVVPGLVVPGFVVPGLFPGFELGEVLPAGCRLGLSFSSLSFDTLSFTAWALAFSSAEAKPGMVKYVDEELTSPGAWINVPTEGFKALIILPLPM